VGRRLLRTASTGLAAPVAALKKVGRLWSVRVGPHYRALAIEDGADLVWFWIGSHADYDRLVGQA
jgi:hypothetical protein